MKEHEITKKKNIVVGIEMVGGGFKQVSVQITCAIIHDFQI